MELIRHEYTLAWIGTNVTFLLGLFGALALVAPRVSNPNPEPEPFPSH